MESNVCLYVVRVVYILEHILQSNLSTFELDGPSEAVVIDIGRKKTEIGAGH